MPTLDEIANAETVGTVNDLGETVESFETPEQPSKANEMFNKVMTAETGAGSIGDYLDHPMNFNKSQGLAQILRGLTGMIGNLNLAVIDVVMGALRFSKERKGVVEHVYDRGLPPA